MDERRGGHRRARRTCRQSGDSHGCESPRMGGMQPTQVAGFDGRARRESGARGENVRGGRPRPSTGEHRPREKRDEQDGPKRSARSSDRPPQPSRSHKESRALRNHGWRTANFARGLNPAKSQTVGGTGAGAPRGACLVCWSPKKEGHRLEGMVRGEIGFRFDRSAGTGTDSVERPRARRSFASAMPPRRATIMMSRATPVHFNLTHPYDASTPPRRAAPWAIERPGGQDTARGRNSQKSIELSGAASSQFLPPG
jgi:hypothetical protein